MPWQTRISGLFDNYHPNYIPTSQSSFLSNLLCLVCQDLGLAAFNVQYLFMFSFSSSYKYHWPVGTVVFNSSAASDFGFLPNSLPEQDNPQSFLVNSWLAMKFHINELSTNHHSTAGISNVLLLWSHKPSENWSAALPSSQACNHVLAAPVTSGWRTTLVLKN